MPTRTSSTSSGAPLTTESHHLQWQKSQQGIWRRDVDELERFYQLCARNEKACLPVTGCASFVTPSLGIRIVDEERLIEAAFRKAWIVLRHRHPTLASRIEQIEGTERYTRIYSSLQDSDEEGRWLRSTFIPVDTNRNALQWFNEDAPAFVESSVFLVRNKQRNEELHRTIFLRCPHDITDGVGVLQLVNQLFADASQAYKQGAEYVMPVWGTEGARLSPCLRLAANIPDTLSKAQSKRFADIQAANAAIYDHPGLLGIPSNPAPDNSAPGKRERHSFLISKSTTQMILGRCKTIAPGVSVTHVFMSALALALSEVQPKGDASYPVRYVNHSMINLRPSCCKPYDSPDHAATAYHTISAQALGIDLVVPKSSWGAENNTARQQLPKIAIDMRDFYRSIRPFDSPGTHEQVALAPMVFKTLTPPSGVDVHTVLEPPFCPVSLSSMGNISSMVGKIHGPFELERVWAASEPIGAGAALFLGTWDGEIELAAVYDNRYHGKDYIKGFLSRVVGCVCEGLDINQRAAASRLN